MARAVHRPRREVATVENITERVLGAVADFCPICRRVREHALIERREVRLLFGIPLGRGAVRDALTCCTTCEVRMRVDRARFRQVLPGRGHELGALRSRTFPDIERVLGPRLAFEALRQPAAWRALPAAEQLVMLLEPFGVLEPLHGHLVEREHDGGVWWAPARLLVATLIAFLVAVSLLTLARGPLLSTLGNGAAVLALALFAAGLTAAAWLSLDRARIIARQVCVPRLRLALAPLGLSRAEVASLLQILRDAGKPLARWIGVDQLCDGDRVVAPAALAPLEPEPSRLNFVACIAVLITVGVTLLSVPEQAPDEWRVATARKVEQGDRFGAAFAASHRARR